MRFQPNIRVFLALSAALAALAACTSPTQEDARDQALTYDLAAVPADESFVPGELVLTVKPGHDVQEALKSAGASHLRALAGGRHQLLAVAEGQELAVAARLNADPGVLAAEPNWIQKQQGPNDPDYYLKWDLHNDGSLCNTEDCATFDADMDFEEAYALLGDTQGVSVVAIVDGGVDLGHPDLVNKLVPGYDFIEFDDEPDDTKGHGTHVAGIAAAEGDNGEGMTGVAYGANMGIMACKACDDDGCPISASSEAIYWATDHGANVINLSLGGRAPSIAQELAVQYAWDHGVVLVGSAGNTPGKILYPAAFPECIAVGSTDWHDVGVDFCALGPEMEVAAPGGNMIKKYDDPAGIYSTMPTYPVYLTTEFDYDNDYDQLEGTSMAAPQVAGLAALLFAVGVADADGDGHVNDEVREFIRSTADDVGDSGWDEHTGWGRVNIHQAVLAATGATGNIPPVASFSYVADKLSCSFDASASYDPDGTIESHAWDFGDGQFGSGVICSHIFPTDDTYTVTLTVTDDAEATAQQARDVTVTSGNLPPVAAFTWSADGLTCMFDAAASYDPDGQITQYAWDFGDGQYGSGPTCDHTYLDGGTYPVTLTVTDDEGAADADQQDVFVGTGGEDTMHIAAIEAWYKTFGPNYQNYFEFTVRDDDNHDVSGATVFCEVELPDASVQALSGVTGTDGTVYVRVWSGQEGVYTVTATGVTHPALTYDPSANVVTSLEHVVP